MPGILSRQDFQAGNLAGLAQGDWVDSNFIKTRSTYSGKYRPAVGSTHPWRFCVVLLLREPARKQEPRTGGLTSDSLGV
jgi:hypothetical protein